MTDEKKVTLTIEVTEFEFEKLKALAAAKTESAKGKRTVTITDCVRSFARSCRPDGGGWTHPMNTTATPEKKDADYPNEEAAKG